MFSFLHWITARPQCFLHSFICPLIYTIFEQKGEAATRLPPFWPTRKDSEPRPRIARAGSAAKRAATFSLLGTSTKLLTSPINQNKGYRDAIPFFWPTRKDSNLRPSESESDALSSCATGRYEIVLHYYSILVEKKQALFEKKSGRKAPFHPPFSDGKYPPKGHRTPVENSPFPCGLFHISPEKFSTTCGKVCGHLGHFLEKSA